MNDAGARQICFASASVFSWSLLRISDADEARFFLAGLASVVLGACRRGAEPLSTGAEACDEDCQIAPATPQGADTRHPIALATEMAAETANPPCDLFDCRHRCLGSWRFAVKVSVQRLPFIFGQHLGAQRGRFTPRQVAQV